MPLTKQIRGFPQKLWLWAFLHSELGYPRFRAKKEFLPGWHSGHQMKTIVVLSLEEVLKNYALKVPELAEELQRARLL